MSRRKGLAAVLMGKIKTQDPKDAYAEACYYIEKELHQTITPDYPVAKFIAQVKLLERDAKRQKKEADKMKSKARGFRR